MKYLILIVIVLLSGSLIYAYQSNVFNPHGTTFNVAASRTTDDWDDKQDEPERGKDDWSELRRKGLGAVYFFAVVIIIVIIAVSVLVYSTLFKWSLLAGFIILAINIGLVGHRLIYYGFMDAIQYLLSLIVGVLLAIHYYRNRSLSDK